MSLSTPVVTNFTAGEISPRLNGRVDLSKYFNGCRILENFQVHPHGGTTRRSGFRFVTEVMNSENPVLLVPFEINGTQAFVLEFGENASGQGRLRIFSTKSRLNEFEMDSPYKAEEFDRLRYAQSGGMLIIVHSKHPPRTLKRKEDGDWTLEAMKFLGQPKAWTTDNYPSVVGFYQQRLVLAATPDKPDTLWLSRVGEIEDFRLKTSEVPFEGWRNREIEDSNSDGIRDGKAGDTVILLDGDGFEAKDGLKGQHSDGSTRYYRYKGTKNYVASGAKLTLTFKDKPAKNQLESIWDTSGTLQSDYWECFEVGDRTEAPAGEKPLDDDAIEVTLAGHQGCGIEFVVSRNLLWIGTAGGEWTLGGGMSQPMTSENVKANHEGTSGASPTRPEPVGFATLYIQRAGKKIREMAYRYESDAYVSKDLTILSEHITSSGLTQMAYVQEPDSIVYGVRKDGVVVALTYVPDQEVAAWSRFITDGVVEGITSVYSDTEKRDQLWAVVRRVVQGQERRFIEILEGDFDGRIENGFFVDSGVTYDGEPTSIMHGLNHLVGRTVSVLADGSVLSEKTVASDGSIALDRPASKIHAGLPYVSKVQPMRIEAGSQRGTAQAKKKRITKVAARFYNTLGGRIGPDETHLEPVYFRTAAVRMGHAPDAFTGDKIVNFPQGWNRDGVLTIVQDQPLPMTVLLIVPYLVVNE
ncbi:hypothetical protein GO013_02210 [Pseudodesulfovibrio sp. JC047]|uniref:hypothetical protein n=1 Tax=Pseudodesulfovibrio sp. JC047 TaxID=2683199 RepID=UPI0013D21623|nr:hypothetical protein [Pseudodesulfovibrio sp. JC047]NDV18232.1 hypothetical protein [Pseudodesulfovibrio sp. JC047]